MTRLIRDGDRFALWRWQFIEHNGSPYITKLYLARTPLFQLCLHWLHRRDHDRALHDHPRDFVSIVLRGGYLEERPSTAPSWESVDAADVPASDTYLVERRRFSVAFRRATAAHRIIRVNPGTLTLVFWGPKRREWGFHTPFAGWVHWRRYLRLP